MKYTLYFIRIVLDFTLHFAWPLPYTSEPEKILENKKSALNFVPFRIG